MSKLDDISEELRDVWQRLRLLQMEQERLELAREQTVRGQNVAIARVAELNALIAAKVGAIMND